MEKEQTTVETWTSQHLMPGGRDKGVPREENKRVGHLEARKRKSFKQNEWS